MNQEIAEAILNWEDHDDIDHFEKVTNVVITSQSRWSTFYFQIYKDKRDGSHWQLLWSRGSTEQQDQGPEDIEYFRVEERIVQKSEWVRV